MQAAGVTAIEKMKMDEVTKNIIDTILLNLRAKLIRLPIFGLIWVINSRTKSSGYSLKSNPSIITISDKSRHTLKAEIFAGTNFRGTLFSRMDVTF